MGGEKISPRWIQVSEGARFRHVLIKFIKIVNSLISIFAFWID